MLEVAVCLVAVNVALMGYLISHTLDVRLKEIAKAIREARKGRS